MSIDYLIMALRFFMMLDTMHNVIKRTKKLLIKLHFIKDIVEEENERTARRNSGQNSVVFENYKNLDIPKNITAIVHEHVSINLTYPKHPLTSIMKIRSSIEKLSLNAYNVSFEMLFNTMKKSYAMHLTSPIIRAEVNQHECAIMRNFKMDMRIIFKKCIRRLVQVLKEMTLDMNQTITFSQLNINLSSNLFLWVMIFDQIYRKMKKEASIKHDMMKKILHSDFLKENLLKQDYEVENEHMLFETKIPSLMKLEVNVHQVECKVFTKDDNNTMKVLIEDYQLNGDLEHNILTAKNYFASLTLLSDRVMKSQMNRNGRAQSRTVYLATKGLLYQERRDNSFENKLPRRFLLKFDTIDLFYNCDLLLSASEDINDLSLISKYFKRQNVNYKVQKKASFTEALDFVGNKLIIDWYLGGRRYLKFVATDIDSVDCGIPWSNKKDGAMHYTFSTISVSHTKFEKVIRNPDEIDLSMDPDEKEEYKKLEDIILRVTDLSYVMRKNKDKLDLFFSSTDLHIYCPNHLHYGAIIKALMKQIKFQIRWHKVAYKEYKVLNRIRLPPKAIAPKSEKKDFNMTFRIQNFSMMGEDKDVTKCLVYQNEIVSMLKEKGLTKCHPKILFDSRRELIKNELQENYTSFRKLNQ